MRALFHPDLLLVGRENSAEEDRRLIEPKREGPLLLAAVHYISPSLGKWFRVLLGVEHVTGYQILGLLSFLSMMPLMMRYLGTLISQFGNHSRRPLVVEMGNEIPTLDQADGEFDILHIDSKSWSELKNEFLKLDAREFYRIVVGLDPLGGRGWADQSRRQLSAVLDQLHAIRLTQDGGVAAKDLEKEWRTLLFSLFLSIRTAGDVPVYTLLLPIYECEPLDSVGVPILPRLGTFVGCYNDKLSGNPKEVLKKLKDIRGVLLPAMRALAMLELHVLEERGSRNVVVIENIIRSCAMLDVKVREDVNVYGRFLRQSLSHLIDGRTDAELPEGSKRCSLQMTGANRQMRDMLMAIQQLVRGANRRGAQKRCYSVSSYSEPGCGKETIASLCHLLSPRCLVVPSTSSSRLGSVLTDVYKNLEDWKGNNDFSGKGDVWEKDLKSALSRLEVDIRNKKVDNLPNDY